MSGYTAGRRDAINEFAADRDLLLWLHAEAVWHRDQLDDEALKWTEVAGRHAEELERGCMHGCDATPRHPAVRPTPGQMLHQLHAMDAEAQRGLVGRMLESQEAAMACYAHGHEERLAEADELRIETSRLRREVEFEAHGTNPSQDPIVAVAAIVAVARRCDVQAAKCESAIGEIVGADIAEAAWRNAAKWIRASLSVSPEEKP